MSRSSGSRRRWFPFPAGAEHGLVTRAGVRVPLRCGRGMDPARCRVLLPAAAAPLARVARLRSCPVSRQDRASASVVSPAAPPSDCCHIGTKDTCNAETAASVNHKSSDPVPRGTALRRRPSAGSVAAVLELTHHFRPGRDWSFRALRISLFLY